MAQLTWFGLKGRRLAAVALLSLNGVACSSSGGDNGSIAQGGDSSAAGGDTGAAGATAHPGCSRDVIAGWTAEGKTYESDQGLQRRLGGRRHDARLRSCRQRDLQAVTRLAGSWRPLVRRQTWSRGDVFAAQLVELARQ